MRQKDIYNCYFYHMITSVSGSVQHVMEHTCTNVVRRAATAVFIYLTLHRISKVPPLGCCNFQTWEWILIFLEEM